ncbi:MAG: hypothetical protein FWG91_00410 [Lachnospiraceae bacterium]|nr:hypothetical protein [Lachnospiraceae bacterium]
MEYQYIVEINGKHFGNEIVQHDLSSENAHISIDTDLIRYKSSVEIKYSRIDFRLIEYTKVITSNHYNAHHKLKWENEKGVYINDHGRFVLSYDKLYAAEQVKFFLPSIISIEPGMKYCAFDIEKNKCFYYKLLEIDNNNFRLTSPDLAICTYKDLLLTRLRKESSRTSIYLNA